jgi:hypothetical protein
MERHIRIDTLPNARPRVLRPGQIGVLGTLGGTAGSQQEQAFAAVCPAVPVSRAPELLRRAVLRPAFSPNETNGRKLADYRALELPCRRQARPAMPNAVRSSRNPLRATSSGRTTALVLPAVLLPCSDEPKRTDNSASQSGARTCARRILRMVEPGSAAPTAAIALFGVGGWSGEVSRMRRFFRIARGRETAGGPGTCSGLSRFFGAGVGTRWDGWRVARHQSFAPATPASTSCHPIRSHMARRRSPSGWRRTINPDLVSFAMKQFS